MANVRFRSCRGPTMAGGVESWNSVIGAPGAVSAIVLMGKTWQATRMKDHVIAST